MDVTMDVDCFMTAKFILSTKDTDRRREIYIYIYIYKYIYIYIYFQIKYNETKHFKLHLWLTICHSYQTTRT